MCSVHIHSCLPGPVCIGEISRGDTAILVNVSVNINAHSLASLKCFMIKSEL